MRLNYSDYLFGLVRGICAQIFLRSRRCWRSLFKGDLRFPSSRRHDDSLLDAPTHFSGHGRVSRAHHSSGGEQDDHEKVHFVHLPSEGIFLVSVAPENLLNHSDLIRNSTRYAAYFTRRPEVVWIKRFQMQMKKKYTSTKAWTGRTGDASKRAKVQTKTTHRKACDNVQTRRARNGNLIA